MPVRIYLARFDKLWLRLAPLMRNLGEEMQKGSAANQAEYEHFIREVQEIRAGFNLLQPPPVRRRVHRAFDRLLQSYERVASSIAGFLKTGDPAYIQAMGDELPNLEALGERFCKEIQRCG